jgi:GT2 family glycosyltransferase
MSDYAITVGILTKDQPLNVLRCLESISISDDISLEILIVDHGSKPETIDCILNFPFPCPFRIFSCAENNLGKSRDFVLREAKHPYVLFLDSDCEANTNWLKNLIQAYVHQNDPQCMGVGGPNLIPNINNPFYQSLSIAMESVWGNGNSTQMKNFETHLRVAHMPTCNLLLNREAALRLGGYSHRFSYVCEDLEFSKRCESLGLYFLFSPLAPVTHWHRASILEWAKKMFRYGRGQILVQAQHPRHLMGPRGLPLMMILSIFGTAIFFPSLGAGMIAGYLFFFFFYSAFLCLQRKNPLLTIKVFLIFLFTHFAYGLGELFELCKSLAQKKGGEVEQGNNNKEFLLLKMREPDSILLKNT